MTEPTSLVAISDDGIATTTSLAVADGTENEHRAVLQLIRSNLSDFEEFGRVAFEMRPFETAGGTQRREVAELTEEHATLLLTYMRNNDVVRTFKKNLVRSFWELKRQRDEVKPLTGLEYARRLVNAEERVELEQQKNKVLQAAIERDAPMVAKAEAHTASDAVVHRQAFAREVQAWGRKAHNMEIKQSDVLQFLGHIGLFIRGERSDTGHATADAVKRGLAFTDKGIHKVTGYAYATGKLTAKGQDLAWKRITKYVGENGSLELPRELKSGDPA